MGKKKSDNEIFTKLRSHHKQLGVPWTDNTFPANDCSIGLNKVTFEFEIMYTLITLDYEKLKLSNSTSKLTSNINFGFGVTLKSKSPPPTLNFY